MESEYAHAMLNLLVVMVLMLGLFFAARKFKLVKNAANKHVNIVNAVSIGAKEKILLIEVNNVQLLVGATPNHIETLFVFNEMESAKSETAEKDRQKVSFSELL